MFRDRSDLQKPPQQIFKSLIPAQTLKHRLAANSGVQEDQGFEGGYSLIRSIIEIDFLATSEGVAADPCVFRL